MANSLLQEVLGVRNLLDNPLSQAPSFKQIVEELQAEYQYITNDTNNTGNSWQIGETTLTTVSGQYRYDLSVTDFYKALNVTTVPGDINGQPQYTLEFTEFENMPKEWAWLSPTRGQYMYSSHDSQLIAFYRTQDSTTGEVLKCEIRPVPNRVQDYKILYQITDWWTDHESAAYKLPHSSQRYYVRALVAQNLLLRGGVKWSFDEVKNFTKGKIVAEGLKTRLERYKAVYDEYKDTLDIPDITEADSWADWLVWQN